MPAAAPPPSAATVAGGGRNARPIQNSKRNLHACKELFFAGFPCHVNHSGNSSGGSHGGDDSRAGAFSDGPRWSKKFIRGFFQQYGAVATLFFDEARGCGSVVFVDGADAEGCYLAVHLSFLPAITESGGIGQPTWEQDEQGEALADRQARPADLLLCLEFAHCCPFVHPALLTREVFVDGGTATCEVPGGDLSRAILLHRFPQLLSSEAHALPMVPVAPHVVVRWVEEADEARGAGASRVEVLEEEEEDKAKAPSSSAVKKAATRLTRVGPNFPGRGIQPVAIEEALWNLLRPSHVPSSLEHQVTVLDLWWEYYQAYWLHKTQPSQDRVIDRAFAYAQKPSLAQEVLQLQRQSREYSHGDEAEAQQTLQRLVHDHQYHNVLAYIGVKQKFKYDPAWASLMRDVYKAKVVLQLQAWQALMTEAEEKRAAESGEGGNTAAAIAAATAAQVPDHEVRRRRVVMKAIQELLEPAPTKEKDIAYVQKAEKTWFQLSHTTATRNVMENVAFLGKVERREVDRNGVDKVPEVKPSLPNTPDAAEPTMDAAGKLNMDTTYPSMSARQKDEQFYATVLQNLDGYVAIGTAEELVSMCEDPKLFRFAKGHIGYEAAHEIPSYWRAYVNALWVPLIAFLLLGFGSNYAMKRLGLTEAQTRRDTAVAQAQQKQDFHEQLRRLVQQQREMADAAEVSDAADVRQRRRALREMNETMQKAAEAARRAGGRFNIEIRGDL